MPKCSMQVLNCDLPIRLDSYSGCSFGCVYCMERLKDRRRNRVPQPFESVRAVKDFMAGKRTYYTNWCDWNIPLHWGGISDPFQPCELRYRRSYEILRALKDFNYPVVISTKSTLLLRDEYKELLGKNVVLQVSLVSPKYWVWEPNAPSFRERLAMIMKLANRVARVIIRVQPYVPEVKEDLFKYIPIYAASGVHGITIEGLQWNRMDMGMTEWLGGSAGFPMEGLFLDYEEISNACHDAGIRFYAAENRLRWMGDHPTCCGCDDLAGFRVNTANDNYEELVFTEKMQEPGTGSVFRGLCQTTDGARKYRNMSYKEALLSLLNIDEGMF